MQQADHGGVWLQLQILQERHPPLPHADLLSPQCEPGRAGPCMQHLHVACQNHSSVGKLNCVRLTAHPPSPLTLVHASHVGTLSTLPQAAQKWSSVRRCMTLRTCPGSGSSSKPAPTLQPATLQASSMMPCHSSISPWQAPHTNSNTSTAAIADSSNMAVRTQPDRQMPVCRDC